MVASMSNRQRGAKGWECYTSKDLRHWQAPVTVFTPPAGFWADRDFWAPEIHAYRGKFYLFGTLSAERAKRGTQLFVADGPLGPFQAHDVNLLRVEKLGHVVITFGSGFATEFEVLATTDGAKWQKLAGLRDQKGGRVEICFDPIEVRILRVRAIKPDGPNQPGTQMSIAELEAYE